MEGCNRLLRAGRAAFGAIAALAGSAGLAQTEGASSSLRALFVDQAAGPANTLGTRSDADIWGDIKHGLTGLSTTDRPEDAILIHTDGWWWAGLRTPNGGALIDWTLWGLGAVLLAILLFAILRGRLRIEGGRSGRRILRHGLAQRVVHWSLASVFILMALTGLILLLGRPFLIPLAGRSVNSVFATASMQAHNLFGFIFIALLAAVFVLFVRGNLPHWRDLVWIARGGGMLGIHARAGRYNAGEKAWFWTLTLAGLVLAVSGILLLFPDDLGPQIAAQVFGTSDQRAVTTLAELAHLAAAVLVIGFALGHIYLGTYGTEGTLESMTDGYVDENWAKTHHDIWFEETREAGEGAAP
jgi:formate dehydrogenase subunit gamma